MGVARWLFVPFGAPVPTPRHWSGRCHLTVRWSDPSACCSHCQHSWWRDQTLYLCALLTVPCFHLGRRKMLLFWLLGNSILKQAKTGLQCGGLVLSARVSSVRLQRPAARQQSSVYFINFNNICLFKWFTVNLTACGDKIIAETKTKFWCNEIRLFFVTIFWRLKSWCRPLECFHWSRCLLFARYRVTNKLKCCEFVFEANTQSENTLTVIMTNNSVVSYLSWYAQLSHYPLCHVCLTSDLMGGKGEIISIFMTGKHDHYGRWVLLPR